MLLATVGKVSPSGYCGILYNPDDAIPQIMVAAPPEGSGFDSVELAYGAVRQMAQDCLQQQQPVCDDWWNPDTKLKVDNNQIQGLDSVEYFYHQGEPSDNIVLLGTFCQDAVFYRGFFRYESFHSGLITPRKFRNKKQALVAAWVLADYFKQEIVDSPEINQPDFLRQAGEMAPEMRSYHNELRWRLNYSWDFFQEAVSAEMEERRPEAVNAEL